MILEHFLQLPSATWRGDRSDALILIARCSDDPEEAMEKVNQAISEAPDRREGYVYLSKIMYEQGHYAAALAAAKKAFDITERPLQYMCEDWAWNWEPWDIAAFSAYHVGNLEDARMYGRIAVQMDGPNQRLQDNLKYYEE